MAYEQSSVTCSISVRLTLPGNLGFPLVEQVGIYVKALDADTETVIAVRTDTNVAEMNTYLSGWTLAQETTNLEPGEAMILESDVVLPVKRVYHVVLFARQMHIDGVQMRLHRWFEKKYEAEIDANSGLVSIIEIPPGVGSVEDGNDGAFSAVLFDNFRRISRQNMNDDEDINFVQDCSGLALASTLPFSSTVTAPNLGECAQLCEDSPLCSYFDYEAANNNCVLWKGTGINKQQLVSAPVVDGSSPAPRQCWAKKGLIEASSNVELCDALNVPDVVSYTGTPQGCTATVNSSCPNGSYFNGYECIVGTEPNCATGFIAWKSKCMNNTEFCADICSQEGQIGVPASKLNQYKQLCPACAGRMRNASKQLDAGQQCGDCEWDCKSGMTAIYDANNNKVCGVKCTTSRGYHDSQHVRKFNAGNITRHSWTDPSNQSRLNTVYPHDRHGQGAIVGKCLNLDNRNQYSGPAVGPPITHTVEIVAPSCGSVIGATGFSGC